MQSFQRYKNAKGFTLIEFIIVTVIMGIIAVVVSRILLTSYQSFINAELMLEGDWQGYYFLERLVNDSHNIRTLSDITTMTVSQFSFVDKNGDTVTYLLSGNNLLRNNQIVVSGLQGFFFAYYNKSYATTTSPASLSYIWMACNVVQGSFVYPISMVFSVRAFA